MYSIKFVLLPAYLYRRTEADTMEAAEPENCCRTVQKNFLLDLGDGRYMVYTRLRTLY